MANICWNEHTHNDLHFLVNKPILFRINLVLLCFFSSLFLSFALVSFHLPIENTSIFIIFTTAKTWTSKTHRFHKTPCIKSQIWCACLYTHVKIIPLTWWFSFLALQYQYNNVWMLYEQFMKWCFWCGGAVVAAGYLVYCYSVACPNFMRAILFNRQIAIEHLSMPLNLLGVYNLHFRFYSKNRNKNYI